jgi:hypothetical protein
MSTGTDLARHRLDCLYDFAAGVGIGTIAVGCLVTLLPISARHGVASSVFRYVGFERTSLWVRRSSWLAIETPSRAAGFLSVVAIAAIIGLRAELTPIWNLSAAGEQRVKSDNQLLLWTLANAIHGADTEKVVLLGGSTDRELTADDPFVSGELTNRCKRDIQFVNLSSSSQSFAESWDILALLPDNARRLILVGINPYRIGFDDSDVEAGLSNNPTGLPTSFSLWWAVVRHTGYVGSLERMIGSVARQQSFGARWRLSDLFVARQTSSMTPSADPFQPDRSSYREPVWTRARKVRQSYEYIATRVMDFHDRFHAGVRWYKRLAEHFRRSGSEVQFLVTPTDESFGTAARLMSADFDKALLELGGKERVIDLRNRVTNLGPADFYDMQHLVARGREKLQPVFVDAVAQALGCYPAAVN